MRVSKYFPILKRKINGKKLCYLDNAATTQLAMPVYNAIEEFEFNHRANVHRGLHTLSTEASQLYEESRKTIAKFIGATEASEIVFVRNSTEALNLIAYSWALHNIKKGDIIAVSEIEHHSNLLPWYDICNETKARLELLKVNEFGSIDVKATNINWARVKLVTITHTSNILGTTTNSKQILKEIKKQIITQKSLNNDKKKPEHFPKIIIDISQSIAHMPINVKKLGADFSVFSGHKMYGPMGIGVLYINRELHNTLYPFLKGGGMVKDIIGKDYIPKEMPQLLEAGTPNVAGIIGLARATRFISKISFKKIIEHEVSLTKILISELSKNKNVKIFGQRNTKDRIGIVTFIHNKIPAHDLATILDINGVAVRAGSHCVIPWHKKNKTKSTVRVSLAMYNTKQDIKALIIGIRKAERVFKFN